MSTRKKTARPISPLHLLTTITKVEQAPDLLVRIIPAADVVIAEMLAGQRAALPIAAAAERLVPEVFNGAAEELALVTALEHDEALPLETRDAAANVQWMNAEAGFALGLAMGMRLAGGVR